MTYSQNYPSGIKSASQRLQPNSVDYKQVNWASCMTYTKSTDMSATYYTHSLSVQVTSRASSQNN